MDARILRKITRMFLQCGFKKNMILVLKYTKESVYKHVLNFPVHSVFVDLTVTLQCRLLPQI